MTLIKEIYKRHQRQNYDNEITDWEEAKIHGKQVQKGQLIKYKVSVSVKVGEGTTFEIIGIPIDDDTRKQVAEDLLVVIGAVDSGETPVSFN